MVTITGADNGAHSCLQVEVMHELADQPRLWKQEKPLDLVIGALASEILFSFP